MISRKVMRHAIPALLVSAGLLSVVGMDRLQAQSGAATEMPVFEVDPSWPPKLPNNWMTGHISSVAVAPGDHVWLLHRPRTIAEADRAKAAPAVIELDATGKFVQAWGGPGTGYDWPDSEHGIFIDYKNNVWVGGSAPRSPTLRTPPLNDDMMLKFDSKGKFLKQIGGRNSSGGNSDTKNLHLPTDIYVWQKTNEAIVTDGYSNRRVIVFDADTLAFKRMWGAFGNKPTDPPPPPATRPPAPKPPFPSTGNGPDQFGSPVHAVEISNDGMMYIADRQNRRVQVFTLDGKYVTQLFINPEGPNEQSAAGLALSPDQRFLYVGDFGNSHIVVVDRKTLKVLYQFGTRGPKPGDFQGVHHIAVDSKGNIYTGEVAPGARAQKFVFKGMSKTPPPNALTAAQLSPTAVAPR